MTIHAEQADVFYSKEDPVVIGAPDLLALKSTATTSLRKRARICTHASPEADLHEMLIALHRDSYVRPHKHLDRGESFSIFEGTADVFLFEDDGNVRTVIPMGPSGSGRVFYYRLTQPSFHTLVVRSEMLVFHEVTEGPFRREQTVFAPWSPAENESAAIAVYLNLLRESLLSTHSA